MGYYILIFLYIKLEIRLLFIVDELFLDMENGIIFIVCLSILLYFFYIEFIVFRDFVFVVFCFFDFFFYRFCVV